MADAPPLTWQPWPVPEKFGGGFRVVLGEPDDKLLVGRQIGAVPGTLTYKEAQALAKTMNRLEAKARAVAPQPEATHG
ncbi:MAG TPA: hypothetical protein VKT20_01140 [Candidatus Dormibacteraeota bacterium]|nr:hypothetical protein [Candidatus Dormibacteraeota bacterium]